MGNICSRSSNETDNFSGPGRVVGSAPQPASSAPVPQKISANSPGRPLGGATDGSSEAAADARRAAARAAEERAEAKSKQTSGGKLSAQLEAQKKQTMNALLVAGSQEEQQRRDADAAAQARSYN